MNDQATELRNLMLRAGRTTRVDHGPSPRMMILGGGKGGVGVTTLAVHLAVVLAEQGLRVVLVDADLYRADVATLCGLEERGSVADVLASRCDIHEVLQPGPGGIQVAPGGSSAPNKPTDYSEIAQQRLLRQLQTLGRHADAVLVDAGNGAHDVARRFWRAADDVLLVTTPEPMAVMDCYATIKRLGGDGQTSAIRLLVNKADNCGIGENVHQRIDASCQRFLGLRVGLLGHVPTCPTVGRPADASVQGLRADTAAAFREIADRLVAEQSRKMGQKNDVTSRFTHENKGEKWAQLQPGKSPMKEQAVSTDVGVNLQRLNQL